MKKLDSLLLIIFPFLAVGLCLVFRLNFLGSIFFFFVVPGIYWSIRTPGGIKRALLFSLIMSVPATLIGDYIGVLDQSWFVPTIFPFRILNQIPVEDLIWLIAGVYFGVIFYEHFIDRGNHSIAAGHLKNFFILVFTLFIIFLEFYLFFPEGLQVPYAYLKLSLVTALLPVAAFLLRFPKFISRVIQGGLYISIIAFLQELTALELGHWSFPGHNFIGWVEFFGHQFPFEEFFFFIVLGGITLFCYFEYFDDDKHLKRR